MILKRVSSLHYQFLLWNDVGYSGMVSVTPSEASAFPLIKPVGYCWKEGVAFDFLSFFPSRFSWIVLYRVCVIISACFVLVSWAVRHPSNVYNFGVVYRWERVLGYLGQTKNASEWKFFAFRFLFLSSFLCMLRHMLWDSLKCYSWNEK